jgi:hypothetical protein
VHSAPPRPAETAPDLAAPKPSTLQAKPSSGATPDHRQSIIDFLGIVKSDEEFNAMQKKVAEGVAPTLDLLTAAGGARCAAVIEEKLSTPLFIRDEIARFMMSRTQPAHVGHAVSMLRYYKANPNPTEDDAAKQFLAVYPNESTALDAANRLWREVNGVKLAMELSILEAAQVRRNYCESTGGDDPQPTSLSVSCDTPEYRVTSVTPPVDGSNVWRVRYDRRGSTGTWEVTPSIRAKTLCTTTCRFIWE